MRVRYYAQIRKGFASIGEAQRIVTELIQVFIFIEVFPCRVLRLFVRLIAFTPTRGCAFIVETAAQRLALVADEWRVREFA